MDSIIIRRRSIMFFAKRMTKIRWYKLFSVPNMKRRKQNEQNMRIKRVKYKMEDRAVWYVLFYFIVTYCHFCINFRFKLTLYDGLLVNFRQMITTMYNASINLHYMVIHLASFLLSFHFLSDTSHKSNFEFHLPCFTSTTWTILCWW